MRSTLAQACTIPIPTAGRSSVVMGAYRVVFVGGKGGFSLSLLHDIPSTGWSLAIPGRDTIYPTHSIYASNYPPTAYTLEFYENRSRYRSLKYINKSL